MRGTPEVLKPFLAAFRLLREPSLVAAALKDGVDDVEQVKFVALVRDALDEGCRSL